MIARLLTESVLGQIVQVVGLVAVAWIGNRKLKRIGADAREARDQTANEHDGAQYPNLRDELTVTRQLTERIAGTVSVLATLTGVSDDALDRRVTTNTATIRDAVAERNALLGELRGEIPQMIRDELDVHVADCPLRNPPGGSS